jgi:hypothetical protein
VNTPAASACQGADLKSVWQTLYREEISWWPYLKSGCSAVVWDYGRHSVKQWQKRWKVTHAEDYDNLMHITWLDRGETANVEVHDSDEVGGDYIPVTCPGP